MSGSTTKVTPVKHPIRILALDGGIPGTTEFSQVISLNRVVCDLQYRQDEDDDSGVDDTSAASMEDGLRPCDIFDYIAGAGMVFTILFTSLQYTVDAVKEFYCQLHERVFSLPSWKDKDRSNAFEILRKTLLDLLSHDAATRPLVKRGKSPKCRAFVCAANPGNNSNPRLFRTYTSRESTSPSCTIVDALLLCLADNDHIEPYPLGRPPEKFIGSGHRFGNPTSRVLQEVQAIESDDRLLSCIVNIGAGDPGPLLSEDLAAIVRDCQREADDFHRRCAGTQDLFFRINVQQGLQTPTLDLGEISSHTNQYLEGAEVRANLNLLGEHLHSQRGVLNIGKTVSFVKDITHSEQKEMFEDNAFEKGKNILEQLVSWDAPYTSAAAYKVQRRQCTENTAVTILREIESWARRNDYPLQSSLCWVYGLAGTGKTTIMQTICGVLEKAGLLASSYFCSIQLDSQESKRIIPTIAQHIASHSPIFLEKLASQLREHPDAAYANLSIQFRNLLSAPWPIADERQFIVAIDALDECDRPEEVLQLLLNAVENNQLPGIKFLVTSRPNPKLLERALRLQHGPRIALHEVWKEERDGDVERFLEEQFHGQLDPEHIHSLAVRADGLFIFAATLAKFLAPSEDFSQTERLELLEHILVPAHNEEQIGLDALYTHILRDAFSTKIRPVAFEKRLRILQAIACTAEATSAHVVADLLGVGVDDVMRVIKSLHAVLFSPSPDKPIYVIHASFQQFITSQTDGPFRCIPSAIDAKLAQSCLTLMRTHLKFNICDIKSSFTPDPELPLAINVIGESLAYACCHWMGHVRKSDEDAQRDLQGTVENVLAEKGLFWMEAMSLLGNIRSCRDILRELWRVPTARLLAQEGDEMISTFLSIVPKMTSQLYLSVLGLREGAVVDHWKTRFQYLPQISTESAVQGVGFSSDGTRVVSGSDDGTVRIWDADSGEQLLQLDGHEDCVNSVAFSPDGKRAVSGSNDETVRTWDADSGEQLLQLDGHEYGVKSVAFSPDGQRVISGSRDGTVRIWDADSGEQLLQLDGHERHVNSVAFSPDGKRTVSGSDDKTVRIWDADSGEQLLQLDGHEYGVNSVAFSHDGKRVVSGSNDETVRIWDADSGEQLLQLDGHEDFVISVAFSHDGKRVVSGSSDETVRIWDADSGDQLLQLDNHKDCVNSVAFSPDGKRTVSSSDDKTVRIWDADSGEQLLQLDNHKDCVNSVAFSPDGKRTVSSSDDKTVRIWDADSGEQLLQLDGHEYGVNSVAFSHDGKRVVSGSNDETVRIWDADSGEQLLQLDGHEDYVKSVAFSSDGKRVASSSNDKTVRIWDADSGEQLLQLDGHEGYVKSVAFSSNGKRVASGSDDKTVRIWDADSGEQLLQLDGHERYVKSVVFSSDGRRVASGSNDNTVRIWDADSGEQLLQLDGHEDYVNSVAFSSDGKRVASGSDDKTVRIWDADSGEQLLHLNGHENYINSVAFSPDMKRVISGSRDNTVHVWDIIFGEPIFQLDINTDKVRSVVFCPDSIRVESGFEEKPVQITVSGSFEETMQIWNIESGSQLLQLNSRADFVQSVAPPTSVDFPQPLVRYFRPSSSSYYLREDGWVVTSKESIGTDRAGFNRIDLSGCAFGDKWSRILRA
ncbi:WD40-repeat-containing domain protein [Flagelloscypha sp. PMI_526]|nr:WD40-repeat-containing domain protein [Flagelloscypha sp. PMI_526]